MVRKTSENPAQSGETDAGADTAANIAAVSEQVAPAIPEPVFATGRDGIERPLTGGTFVRIDGKLQRREA